MTRPIKRLVFFCVSLVVVTGVAACGRQEGTAARAVAELSIDRVPPMVRRPYVQLSGTASPGARVTSGSAVATVDASGRWRMWVELGLGENTIAVQVAPTSTMDGVTKNVVTTRRRTQAETAAAARAAARATARRRARAAARREAQARSAERREARDRRAAKTPADNGNGVTEYNLVLSPYLSQLIDDPDLTDETSVVNDLRQLVVGESQSCEAVIDATIAAVSDTSGSPDERRARILDASAGIYTEC